MISCQNGGRQYYSISMIVDQSHEEFHLDCSRYNHIGRPLEDFPNPAQNETSPWPLSISLDGSQLGMSVFFESDQHHETKSTDSQKEDKEMQDTEKKLRQEAKEKTDINTKIHQILEYLPKKYSFGVDPVTCLPNVNFGDLVSGTTSFS